ncbi:MAG TPA: ABC transporter permease [Anaerolineaceae bacterium]|nr:ABC transporter permease [Anaerolineaceae bacterium]
MTTSTVTQTDSLKVIRSIWDWIRRIPPVYPVFLVIFIAVGILNHNYQTANGIMTFLRRVSPLAILAIGEMMVLATGGFDLSIGSIVTMVVIVSSLLLHNDPANALPTIGIMLGLGVLIGLTNGLVVSFLKVPSFIATLGMMLLVRGGALYWVGGAPQGYLTDNWRSFGRDYLENIPLLGRVPYALLILLVIAVVAYLIFHRSNFGKQILAIGDNVRASQLSGVNVRLVRTMVFLISSVLAVIGGVMIGGYGGVNVTIGQGLEMQTIAACVVGGTLLTGGKGSVPNVIFGAFTMEAIFNLLNLLGLPKPYKDVIQGLIIIGAVAYVSLSSRKKA